MESAKVKQMKGSGTQDMGASPTFSSFPSFFRSPGARVTGSPGSITSALFIPLLTATPAPPAPGKLTIRSHVE